MTTVEATPVETPAPARPSLLNALRVRDFRLVWIGESISILGDQFYMIALPWLALQLTGSGLVLGTVAAVGGIPRAVLMVLGGAITDRLSPRTVMLVSNVLRLLITALLTIVVLTGATQLWMLYLSAFVFGLVDAFFFPAQSAIVPQLVESDQIESGNAMVQITAQLGGFVGPALAGLVIASLSGAANMQALVDSGRTPGAAGIGTAFGFDALTFLIAAIALWLMTGGRKAPAAEKAGEPQQSIRAAIGEGLRYVWTDSMLRTLIFLTAAINFLFTGPMGVGMPVLANTRFAEGAAALGIIFSAFGGGALLGALLAGSLPTPRKLGVLVMFLLCAAGIGMAAFGFVNSLPVAGVVAALMGATVGYTNVVMISWLQKRIDPQYLGRVMSLVMLGSFGLGPISNLLAGVMVDVNLTLMYALAGGLLIAITLFSASNRDVRAMQAS
jgi:MFS family permease